MYFGLIVSAYGYAYFAPGIIQSFGYSPVQTQRTFSLTFHSPFNLFPLVSLPDLFTYNTPPVRSVPPWAAAFAFSMVVAFISDRARHRFLFIVLTCCVAIAGFAMLLSGLPNTAKYGALFLVTSGTYTALPLIVCLFNMNLGGHHRRAVGSAWQIGFGNSAGIISTYAFLPKDQPAYVPGYSICIAFICLSLLASVVYFVAVVVANRRRRSITNVGLTEYESTEMGDLSPRYRYMY